MLFSSFRQLFRIDGVKSVFFGPDFITITKVKNRHFFKQDFNVTLCLSIISLYPPGWWSDRVESDQTGRLRHHYGLLHLWTSCCQWGRCSTRWHRLNIAFPSVLLILTSSLNPRSLIKCCICHTSAAPSEDDDEVVAMIKELLDTRIRYSTKLLHFC